MSLKQHVENNSIAYVITVAATAFAAGWGAHLGVQQASGQASIAVERIKQLDDFDSERRALNIRVAALEAENAELVARRPREPLTKTDRVLENATARVEAQKLVRTHEEPHQFPITISDVTFTAPGGFKIGERIIATFTQIIKPGNAMQIWVLPSKDSTIDYTYEPSSQITKSGVITRYIVIKGAGVISGLVVQVAHGEERAKILDIPLSVRVTN